MKRKTWVVGLAVLLGVFAREARAVSPPSPPGNPETTVSEWAYSYNYVFGTLTSQIYVGQSGLVNDVDLFSYIYTVSTGGCEITLISPQGTRVVLLNHRGTGTRYNQYGVTWDDSASTNVADYPWVNNVTPSTLQPEEGLARLRGESITGTWTLEISNPAYYNTFLYFWNLQLSVVAHPTRVIGGSVAKTTPQALTDGATVDSTLGVVAGFSSFPTKINVTVDVTHPNSGELAMELVSPGGVHVPLIPSNTASSLADVFAGTTFDASAPIAANTYAGYVGGTVTASIQPKGRFDQLIGQDPSGTWHLMVTELAGGSTGTLNGWRLEFFDPCDECRPKAALTPSANDFGTLVLGSSGLATFTLRNLAEDFVHVTQVFVTGEDAGDFEITTDSSPTIPQHGSAPVTVRFGPTQPGPRKATLVALTDDPAHPLLLAGLSGVGSGPSPACVPSVTAAIGSSDLALPQRLFRDSIIANCGGKAYPGSIAGTFYAKVHTFRNPSPSAACMTVTLDGTTCGTGDAMATLYDGAFSATDLAAHYVSDPGSSSDATLGATTFSGTVSGGKMFTVLVNSLAGSCDAYTLSVAECAPGLTSGRLSTIPAATPFGRAAMGAPVHGGVTLANSGGSALHITAIGLGGPNEGDYQLTLPTLPLTLLPGKDIGLPITFTAAGTGERAANLIVTSDDPVNPTYRLTLGGEGVAAAVSSGAAVAFGTIPIGTTVGRGVGVANAGLTPIHVNAIALSGPNASHFTVVNPPTLPLTLAAGETLNVAVNYLPGGTAVDEATLTVSTDAAGTATSSTALTGQGTIELATDPETLDFGTLPTLGAPATRHLTLRNLSPSSPLVINALTSNSADYTVSTTSALPLTLPPNGSTVVTVQFQAKVAGARPATLTCDTGFRPGALTVNLQGTGGAKTGCSATAGGLGEALTALVSAVALLARRRRAR